MKTKVIFHEDEGGKGDSCSSSPCCIGDEPRGSITGIFSGERFCWCWIVTGIETGAVKTAGRFDRLGDCCSVELPENDGYRWLRSRTASSYLSTNWCLFIDTEW
jgi:hypothetical protein